MDRRKFIRNSVVSGLAISTIPFACSPAKDTEFLILGAGLSGLCLAYFLEKAGRDYMIIEGSKRIGGRLFTHPTIGRDVGGRGVGDKYVELMKVIEELEVELVDITNNMRSPYSIYSEGKLYPTWEDSMTNPRLKEFMGLSEENELTDLEGWYKSPELDIPYHKFLQAQGKTDADLRQINISANYNDIYQTSAINSYHSRAFRKYNGSKRIFNFKGGGKQFVDKIVSRLSANVMTDKMVTKISESKEAVKVNCRDGSSYTASKAISTLPFSTLKEVALDVQVSPDQKTCIDQLGYTKITQIHLKANKPYWEEDGIAPSMWTDTPIERIMDMSPDSDDYDMVCWVNGTGTKTFDNKSDAEIAELALKTLYKIRPASEGKVDYIGTFDWGNYEFNKGAYAEFKVGQAGLFTEMIKPAGRLHFAGEHTAHASRGLEGAAESARRVFNKLVN